MAISEEQKEEVRAKVDIADIVSSYGYHLDHKSGALWCCCPFHNEKTPSFKVDESRGTYHCFGCGESGDVFDFVMKQEGLTFGDAIKKLADAVGVELKQSENPQARQRKRLSELMANLSLSFNKMLHKSRDGEGAREYLKSRQLDDETVDRFLIGYAPASVDKIIAWASKHGYSTSDLAAAGIIKPSTTEGQKPYFYFSNRLVFAIKDKNGQVVAFSGRQLVEDKRSGKYINSPETILFKKSRNFFAFDEARKFIVKAPNREAIVCEGQIDCIRLHMNGYSTAVAPLGTAFTEDHAMLLHKVADSALLCFDDDGAGHKATIRTAQLLLAEGMPIRVLSLPDGDDPDSFLLKHGKEAFGNLVEEKSESIVHFQIRAERAKESNQQDTNSEARVAKAVLETIAKCKDKVLMTVLLKDAAKELGIEYATLREDISKEVKKAEQVNKATAEQLIEPPVAGNAADVNNLPDMTEGTFLNFILSNEDDPDIRNCVKELTPPEIFHSPMARKLVEAWIKGKTEEEEPLREVVESLSDDEYRYFIRIKTNIESARIANNAQVKVKSKTMVVYYARQLWHQYIVRSIADKSTERKDKAYAVSALKTLHTATIKGVVRLIKNFEHERFQKGVESS